MLFDNRYVHFCLAALNRKRRLIAACTQGGGENYNNYGRVTKKPVKYTIDKSETDETRRNMND